jgi:hypothetical protein
VNFEEQIHLFVQDSLDKQPLSVLTALLFHIYLHYFCTTVFILHRKIIYALMWNNPEMSAHKCTFLFLEHVMSIYFITKYLLLCL